MGEDEKVRNLFRLLEDELAARRRLLAPFGGMFTAYARAATNPIPAIVVIIEGLAALLETYEDARDRLMRLTRECSKYGIFFVVTAEALTTVGFRMAQNFGRTLALRMNDEAEYSSVMGVGRVTLLSEAYGAGLVKIDEVLQFQTAHARSSEASDAEAIREYISDTFGDYAGPRAQSIPVLPDVVSVEYLASRKVPEKILPFGVSVATLGVVGYDPLAEPMTFVSSDDGDGLLSLVTALCDYYATSGKCSVVVLDPLTTLDGFSPEIAEALGYRQGLQAVGETIVSYARGETPLPQLCILTDVSSLLSSVDYDMKREIEGYFIRLGKQDPSFVVVERSATLGNLRYEPWMSSYLTGTGVWLGNGFNDQSIVKPASFSAEFMRPVEEGFGYVVFRGKVQYCKLLQSAKAEGQGGE